MPRVEGVVAHHVEGWLGKGAAILSQHLVEVLVMAKGHLDCIQATVTLVHATFSAGTRKVTYVQYIN